MRGGSLPLLVWALLLLLLYLGDWIYEGAPTQAAASAGAVAIIALWGLAGVALGSAVGRRSSTCCWPASQ